MKKPSKDTLNPLGNQEVDERVITYLNYYNEERIQEKFGNHSFGGGILGPPRPLL